MNNTNLPNEVIVKLEENGFSEDKLLRNGSCINNSNKSQEIFSKQISSTNMIVVTAKSENCFIIFHETDSVLYSIYLKFSVSKHKNVFIFWDQILDFFCSYNLTGNCSKIISFKLNEEADQQNILLFEEFDGDEDRLLIFYENKGGKRYLLSEVNKNTSLLTASTNNK